MLYLPQKLLMTKKLFMNITFDEEDMVRLPVSKNQLVERIFSLNRELENSLLSNEYKNLLENDLKITRKMLERLEKYPDEEN